MNVFIAIPENREIEMKTANANGFEHNGNHYDFSISLGEGVLVSRNAENWLVFCHRRSGSLPISELQIEIDGDDELRIENAEFQAIGILVNSADGIVRQGGEIDDFLSDYSFEKIQNEDL